jgi:hypothetical protein
MIYIILNVVAILVATGTALSFGFVFYRLVNRQWALSSGTMITAFVAEFWLASILAGALILAPPEGSIWTMTLGSPVVIWIGFVAPVLFLSYRVRGMRFGTALIDALHWLGAMLIMAIVMHLIGLVAPPV